MLPSANYVENSRYVENYVENSLYCGKLCGKSFTYFSHNHHIDFTLMLYNNRQWREENKNSNHNITQKKFEKSLKKGLTNKAKCDIIKIQSRETNLENQKITQKKIQKISKKGLTNKQKCDIIKIQSRETNSRLKQIKIAPMH